MWLKKLVKLNTVQKKFTFFICTVVLLLLILLIFYQLSVEIKQDNMNLNTKGQLLLTSSTYSIIDPLYNYNDQGIKIYAESLLKDSDVASVLIVDSHNKCIFEQSKNNISNDLIFENDVQKDSLKIGHIKLSLTKKNINNKTRNRIFSGLFQITLMLILVYISITLLVRVITNPIKKLSDITKKLSLGDLSVRANIVSNDEIGELACQFNLMADSLVNEIKKSKNVTKDLEKSFDMLQKNAIDISYLAQQLSASSQELVGSNENISDIMNSVVTLSKELSTISTKNLNNANVAEKESIVIENVSENGNTVVQEVIKNMDGIANVFNDIYLKVTNFAQLSSDMEKISQIIINVESQINLLSFNASIEAARSGANCGGFTVIADEILKLSKQTNNAMQDIILKIKHVKSTVDETIHVVEIGKNKVQQGVEITQQAEKSLLDIRTASLKSHNSVKQIQASSVETNDSVSCIVSSCNQVHKSLTEITAFSEELSSIANQLQTLAMKNKI